MEMQDLLRVLDSVGRRAWINQPSTHQRWHRFHGQTGFVIPQGGKQIFHFVPVNPENLAVEIEVTNLEVSRGWPK